MYCKLQLEMCIYIKEIKLGIPKCNIINEIISFIHSLHFLRIWIKRLKTNQTSFHTDTYISLIWLVTYNVLC